MTLPRVVTREQWLAARMELLAVEKQVTRARDAVAARRRELPMVAIEEEYVFEGRQGKVTLLEMFEGRRQLITYHFMFGPEQAEGHAACAVLADSVGRLEHLHAHDTTLGLVSRAPYTKLDRFRARMGWVIPWYSSAGSQWSYDFHATMDESVAPVMWNYKTKQELEQDGTPFFAHGDWHGLSVFLRDGDRIFHTYSTFSRGLETLLMPYNYLDLTPLGRQEGIDNFKTHDAYTPAELAGSHPR